MDILEIHKEENIPDIFCWRNKKLLIFATPTEKGSVVQLVRMPPCHGGGRGFESRPVRKNEKIQSLDWIFFCLSILVKGVVKNEILIFFLLEILGR